MSASRWRAEARRVIEQVTREHVGDEAALVQAISDAYPFGSRTHHPYKIWLSEVRRAAAIRDLNAPLGKHEYEATQVAHDLVELGRVDEANDLLAKHAPNRHRRPCRTCGAKSGAPCIDLSGDLLTPTSKPRVIPHAARIEAL